ncbi:clavaminate synthase-like protein, partial [Tanacetum coccineum]
VGRGWKATFMTDNKIEAEERAAKLGTKLEWIGDNAKVIIGPKPSFRYDEARKRKIWFNGLAIAYGGVKDKLNDDPAKEVVFGDGEPLPPEKVEDMLKMLDEECVALQWQKGDVLLLDNLAVLHARRPLLAPPRRILASFYSVKASKSWLELQLHQHGAILFKGFPVSSAFDFNEVVEAFGYSHIPYTGGAAIRTHVVGNVFTTNESPLDQKIHFHREMALRPEYPSKLFFFCEEEPVSGGETPIVLSHIIYDKMMERHPSFVQQMEELGLMYNRVLAEEDDLSSPVGLGWKSKFSTSDKCIAQERAAMVGMQLRWMESGLVEVKQGSISGIRYDETRNHNTWFNMLVSASGGFENELNDDLTKAVTLGNGQTLPAHVVHDCSKIMDEECVAIPWQKGDVLNYLC